MTRNGSRDATVSAAAIRGWWRRWPFANVAMVTAIVVVDVDPRHDGDQSLEELEARHGRLPETPTVLTGGGGLHYYFRSPADVEIKNSTGLLGPGLDVRGLGGYALAPPSVHASGNTYMWELSSRIDELPLAEPPGWLLHPQAFPREANDNLGSPRVDFVRLALGIQDGARDIELFRLACSLRHRGFSRTFAERAVVGAARRCRPPFPEREAMRKVKSAWRYQP